MHARLGGLENGAGVQAAGVVRVEVNRNAELLAQGLHQPFGGIGTAKARHVLDAENVRAHAFQFLRHADVVVQRVFLASGVQHVAGVTYGGFAHGAGLERRLHRRPHVVHAVQRIEDAEDVHALVRGFLDEFRHHVVGIGGIAHGVRGAQQHLETDVGDGFPQAPQADERIFVQEAQAYVERRASPHFQAEETGHAVRHEVGDRHHVIRTDTGGQQRLVGIAERGIGEQQTSLRTRPFGETFRPQLLQNLASAHRRAPRNMGRDGRRSQALGRRLAGYGRVAVHDDIGQIGEQPGGAVAARSQPEQRGRLFDPAGTRVAGLKLWMIDHVFQERNIGLHAPHAELTQGAAHAVAGVAKLPAPGRDLDQQRIVIRSDDRSAGSRSAVQTNPKARRRTIGRNFTVIRKEVIQRIFGGDAALQGVTVERNFVLLRQVHLRAVQLEALRHLNLAAHHVDAGHHLRDRVLHLNPRIDLDEIPGAGIGVHQELHRTRAVITGGARQLERGIGQLRAQLGIEGDGGRNFNHLLMPALHGAIALM